MASEIRVNKITHTAGVGTYTPYAHGVVISVLLLQIVLVVLILLLQHHFMEVVQILQESPLQRSMDLLELEVIYR